MCIPEFITRARELWRTSPSRIVVEMEGQTITAGALEGAVEGLAERLKRAGVGPGARVSIELPRSPHWLVAALATWRLQAAWVAVDIELPAARKRSMLELVGACVRVEDEDGELHVVAPSYALANSSLDPIHCPNNPEAYVIFSSGSSGAAKAISVGHRGLVAMLDAQIAAFELNAASRALWALSPGFDASVSDWGSALLSGARLLICPLARELPTFLEQAELTHADLPPAILPCLDPERVHPRLRCLITGGEVPDAAALLAWSSRARVIVVYGPTEATVCTSSAVATANWHGASIGEPLPGVEYAVVDSAGERRAEGESGELWIAGRQLARGYLSAPAMQAAKFVRWQGQSWYRSGDLVRRMLGGYEFLGRIDRQVKISGRLVTLEEVEAHIRRHEAVTAASVSVENLAGRPRLLGHVELCQGPKTAVTSSCLQAWLAERLPQWMIPEHFIVYPRLARTPSGKIDHSALQGLASLPQVQRRPEKSAQTETELSRVLSAIARITGRRADPDVEAGRLGLDSLDRMRLVAELAGEEIYFAVGDLSGADTLRTLSTAGTAKAGVSISYKALKQRAWHTLRRYGLDSRGESVETTRREHVGQLYPGARVLLSGATGAFGGQLLHALLARGYHVICGIRDQPQRTCVQRLKEIHSRLPAAWRPRCRATRFELGAVRLGHSESSFAALGQSVDAIMHCAAEVDLLGDLDDLYCVNVDSVGELIRLADSGGVSSFHQISTLSVYVSRPKVPVRAAEIPVCDDAQLLGGYAQSKACAEALLLAARVPGLRIYRLGLLMDESGHASPRVFCEALRHRIELGCSELAFDCTPSAWAARVLLRLAHAPASATRVQHIAGSRMTAKALAQASDIAGNSGRAARALQNPQTRPLSLFQAGRIIFDQRFRADWPDLAAAQPHGRGVLDAHLQRLQPWRSNAIPKN